MSKEYLDLELTVNDKDLVKYLNSVSERTQIEIEARIPSVRRRTKSVVQAHSPVDRGIYRRSIILNNYAKEKYEIGYQVYAKPPHYRLSHLLEGRNDTYGGKYAHILKQFRWGQGEPTRKGRIGMVRVGMTKRYQHLKYGLEYAEEAVRELYDLAIKKSIKKGKRK